MSKISDAMLSEPADGKDAPPLTRVALHEDEGSEERRRRFQVGTRDFKAQYAPIYCLRLQQLRPVLVARAHDIWSHEDVHVSPRILDLTTGQNSVIIGTIFKDMPLRPNVLEDYAKQRGIIEPPGKGKYTSGDDTVVLEDEGARIKLLFDNLTASEEQLVIGNGGIGASGRVLSIGELMTGMVIAVKGKETTDGEFEVEDICFPGIPPQPSLPSGSDTRYVALLCGLDAGGPDTDRLKLSMMFDYLSGHLSSPEEHKTVAKIARVIVAGNVLAESFARGKPPSPSQKKRNKGRTQEEHDTLVAPLREIDSLLAEVAANVEVDVMPGENDPSNFTLPQQPFNRCLFHSASRYATFQSCTNPYDVSLHGCRIAGTSGQTIDNMKQYMTVEEPLTLLEMTLHLRHWAPTAPDTLAAYPFYDKDPFIMMECPHVYFAASQDKFQTKLITGPEGQRVRLICIPRFSETAQLVLLDTASLDVQVVNFGVRW